MSTKNIAVYFVSYASAELTVELDDDGKYDEHKVVNLAKAEVKRRYSNQVEWEFEELEEVTYDS